MSLARGVGVRKRQDCIPPTGTSGMTELLNSSIVRGDEICWVRFEPDRCSRAANRDALAAVSPTVLRASRGALVTDSAASSLTRNRRDCHVFWSRRAHRDCRKREGEGDEVFQCRWHNAAGCRQGDGCCQHTAAGPSVVARAWAAAPLISFPASAQLS